MRNPESLDGELREAEQELKSTLEQACATDVVRADTGELIRVEEMLAIASDAAKTAISIRRKRHESNIQPDVPVAAATTQPTHREFTDDQGTAWTVRAVHPLRTGGARKRLLGDFERGWLAFECAHAKRRLSPIPEAWEALDDDALTALCARATAAAGRRAGDDGG